MLTFTVTCAMSRVLLSGEDIRKEIKIQSIKSVLKQVFLRLFDDETIFYSTVTIERQLLFKRKCLRFSFTSVYIKFYILLTNNNQNKSVRRSSTVGDISGIENFN